MAEKKQMRITISGPQGTGKTYFAGRHLERALVASRRSFCVRDGAVASTREKASSTWSVAAFPKASFMARRPRMSKVLDEIEREHAAKGSGC